MFDCDLNDFFLISTEKKNELEGGGEINGCLFWTWNSVCVCVRVRWVIKEGGKVCPFQSNIKMSSLILIDSTKYLECFFFWKRFKFHLFIVIIRYGMNQGTNLIFMIC